MEENLFGYHLLDSREIKEVIKDKTIDVTITSPPYWKMKNYDVVDQLGYGQGYDEYLYDLTKIFKDIYDITEETGSLWIIVDTFKEKGKMKLLPFDIVEAFEKSDLFDDHDRWILQDIIIWDKEKTLPWSRKGQIRNIFEYILFFIKSKNFKYNIDMIKIPDEKQLKSWWVKYPERYNPHGKAPENIWKFKIPTQGSFGNSNFRHFCPFPPELAEQIILLTTDKGDTVLDPFAGSGTVLAQADCMERKYIGFDLNEQYKKMFEQYIIRDIHQAWEEKELKLEQLMQKRVKFSKNIKDLRQVKFPKTLIKEINKGIIKKKYKNFPIYEINSIFAISNENNSNNYGNKYKFIKEDIYIIFNSKVNNPQIKEIIDEVIGKSPLSKFGIEPTFYFLELKDFITELDKNNLFEWDKIWLYNCGLVNKYNKLITLDEWKMACFQEKWKNNFKKEIPPILSNIKVKIEYKPPI